MFGEISRDKGTAGDMVSVFHRKNAVDFIDKSPYGRHELTSLLVGLLDKLVLIEIIFFLAHLLSCVSLVELTDLPCLALAVS